MDKHYDAIVTGRLLERQVGGGQRKPFHSLQQKVSLEALR
jgi:hypothetical protein